jgi:hypothetical protein
MTNDTCTVHIRIHRADEDFAICHFGKQPAQIEDRDDGAGDVRLLVFTDVEPHHALQHLTHLLITFDGRYSDSPSSPGYLFASRDGEYESARQPYGVVSVPIDPYTLEIDQDAMDDLSAFSRLIRRVQEDFDHRPDREPAPAASEPGEPIAARSSL